MEFFSKTTFFNTPFVFRSAGAACSLTICKVFNTSISYLSKDVVSLKSQGVSNLRLNFLSQKKKNQCPFFSNYSEFSKTPPTIGFWMSLKVVMAVFQQKDIFLGHPVSFIF